jgi:hypothetical protein
VADVNTSDSSSAGDSQGEGSLAPNDIDTSASPSETSTDEAGQSELDLGVISTGVPVVDEALSPLEAMGELHVQEHAAVFERVLSDLAATMAEGAADEGPPSDV